VAVVGPDCAYAADHGIPAHQYGQPGIAGHRISFQFS
jgi:hypothetical protein